MQAKIIGYLNFSNNPAFDITADLNTIKNIYIKVLNADEINKLMRIINTYKEQKHPVKSCAEGGYLIKINTAKLSKYLSTGMLNTPREKWNNQEYLVAFRVLKYEFKSKNSDNIIKGIRFALTDIDFTK